jgi:Flp pilus assembly protein TadD
MKESFERGVKLYHSHRPEQALAEFRQLEQESGSTPELEYYRGLALTQLGRHEEALLALEKVVASHFSFLHVVQARMVLGYIYSVTGRHRLAEFEFNKVCELGLQSSQALAALGFVLYAQRRTPTRSIPSDSSARRRSSMSPRRCHCAAGLST